MTLTPAEQKMRDEDTRLECVRHAVQFSALLDSGPVASMKIRDPVALAKQFYEFVSAAPQFDSDDWVTKKVFDVLDAARLPIPIRIARKYDKSVEDFVQALERKEIDLS